MYILVENYGIDQVGDKEENYVLLQVGDTVNQDSVKMTKVPVSWGEPTPNKNKGELHFS